MGAIHLALAAATKIIDIMTIKIAFFIVYLLCKVIF